MISLVPWAMLLLGIVVGCLLTWFFNRRGRKQLEGRVARLQAEVIECDRDLTESRTRVGSLQVNYDGRIRTLDGQMQMVSTDLMAARAKLAGVEGDCEAQITTLKVDLEQARGQLAVCNSDLEQTRGRLSALRSTGAAPVMTGKAGASDAERAGAG